MKQFIGKLTVPLIKVIGKLPFTILYGIGTLVGHFLWLTGSRGAKVARINIAMCYPELDEAAQVKLARQAIVESGKTFLEISAAWSRSYDTFKDRIVATHGESVLLEAIKKGNGVILVSSHLGNFEVLIQHICQYCSLTILYREGKIAAIEQFMTKQRSRYGARLVPTTREGITEFANTIHKKGVIALAADPEPSLERGSFAPFFNVPALTGHYIIDLLRETEAEIIGVHIARDAEHGLHVHFDEYPESIRSADMLTALTTLNKVLENRIRHNPTQYQWSYKRFKRRPNGESIYR